MASDGCQPHTASMRPFSYLPLHGPATAPSAAGASYRTPQAAPPQAARDGNVGTWHGEAPRGRQGRAAEPPAASRPEARQRDYALCGGGARIPLIGLGTNRISQPEQIGTALEVGYRHLDCASAYKNEEVIGRGLKAALDGGLVTREQLFVASKLWNNCHCPADVRPACQLSLSKLGLEYLDLYYMHWPDAFEPGTSTPFSEGGPTIRQTWEALEGLVDEGLVRRLGVSNFSLAQLEALLGHARHRPVVNQIELHPLLAQRKLVGTSFRKGVHSVAYCPLGHGVLGLGDEAVIKAIAQEVGRTPSQVLLRWNVQRGVVVIPGSTSRAHQQENIEGLFDWELTEEQKGRLDRLDEGKRSIRPPWHKWEDPLEGGATRPSSIHGLAHVTARA